MTEPNRDHDTGRTATHDDAGPLPAERRATDDRGASTRRRLLTALGAACLPAVAGCSGGSTAESTPASTTTDRAPTAVRHTTTGSSRSADAESSQPPTTRDEGIDPRFGFVGTRDQIPPVEPDHNVQLEIRSREGSSIPEFYFEPTGLAVDVGDTVRFSLTTPHHNVNAYHPAFGYTRRVPESAPPYSSPVLYAGEYWLYTFRQEGVHDVTCAPHEPFGMAGRIVVGSPTGPGAMPVGTAPGGERARPPEFTAGLVLSDPALRPEAVAARGSVPWDDLAPESKRPMLRPVEE